MDFKIENLEVAYTKNGISYIEDAVKGFDYFLNEDLTIPLVLCDGEIVRKYWRKKSNISAEELKRVFGNSESIEHYNAKMRFVKDKVLVCDTLNVRYKAHSSKAEYYIKNINKIVDVAYFDANNELMLAIEVYHTNKKTSEDKTKFNNENIVVYEYDINKRRNYPISASTSIESIRTRIRNGRRHIQELGNKVEETTEEANSKWRTYYELKEYAENESIEDEIAEAESKIETVTDRNRILKEQIEAFDGYAAQSIKEYRRHLQDEYHKEKETIKSSNRSRISDVEKQIKDTKNQIKEAEQQIARFESNIEKFRNNIGLHQKETIPDKAVRKEKTNA